MAITQLDTGAWLLDLTLGGRGGKRVRRQFSTKEKARRFEAQLLTNNKDALDAVNNKQDKRRLSDLVSMWYQHHGITLKDEKTRINCLNALVVSLDNPIALKFKSSDFTEYRIKKLADGLSPNTLNHHLAYLRSVFNELIRLGEWQHPNPLKVRSLKVDERELSFLTTDQLKFLLSYLSGDAYKVTLLCLATGARWSEAETIRAEQIQPYRVTYSGTKSGKVRVIPITPELYATIKTKEVGRLFKSCSGAFRYAVKRSGLELPDGQLTHILRHTFSSHFIMNGGNILTLQKILGHSTLTMTIRYAHLAPEHLQEATRYNPVVTLSSSA